MMSTIIASTIASKLMSVTTKVVVGILAVCVALIGWHLNWDYSQIGTLPVFRNIASTVWPATPLPDIETIRENLVSYKNDLLQKKIAQLREQVEGDAREADLEARRDKLARDIVEAERNGSTIRFAQRTLSIGDGKEQLRKLGKVLAMAVEKRGFRASVLSQIEANIGEVSENIVHVDQAISVKEVADVLSHLEKSKKEAEQLVDRVIKPFFDVSVQQGGVLTEDELSQLPLPQTVSHDDADIEMLLDQYRTSTTATEKDGNVEVRRVKRCVKTDVFK